MSVSLKLTNDFKKLLTAVEKDQVKFGVAVSGGGDSMALLHMLIPWALQNKKKLFVVTIDHNLRSKAVEEAELVQKLCNASGIDHSILKIQNQVSGNIQAWARENRYQLITKWANENGIKSIFLGHNLDDQAETVLLRLGRGSGVDGLAAMAFNSFRGGINWLRPLLNTSRQDLRKYLKAKDICYVDDPSNEDVKFNRIKVRKILKASHEYGLDSTRLVETSQRMAQARDVLNRVAFQFAQKNVLLTKLGTVTINLHNLELQLPETKYRIMSYLVKWVSGNPYGARAKTLENTIEAVFKGKARTCCGCMISALDEKLHISREFNAVRNIQPITGIWDNRWSFPANSDIRACGEEGLQQIEDWKKYMFPRNTLLAMPTIWKEGKLYDHLLFKDQISEIKLIKKEKDFYIGILSY